MHKLEALWQYQQADSELDRFEASLRNSESYKRFVKVRAFLDEQKKLLQRLSDTMEQRKKVIEITTDRCDLLNDRYAEGLAKFEAADKSNIAEVEKYRKYFEQLLNLIAQERKSFSETVSTLEKEDEQLAQMRVRVGRSRKEYDELKLKCDQERAQAQTRIDELKTLLLQEEKNVDKQLLDKYRAVKKSQSTPVAKVLNNKCGGCNMELPAVISRKLVEGNELVECDNCGRILYYE